MSEKGLVSTITPCYNGEKHIFRLLDSILSQTYPKIETIIVDDGSTDNTKGVIQAYVPRFKDKGYTLLYIYQENSGQAAAINKALGLYNGEYLVWPDSDDYYSSSESIEKMVNALKNTDEKVSMVRTNAIVVDENSLNVIGNIVYPQTKSFHSFFLDCILENRFNLVPGKFLVKSEILKKELIQNEIYPSRGGQNWQILLPILYNYKIITIHEFLFTIVERKDSHSRRDMDLEAIELKKIVEHEDILNQTILRIKNLKDNEKENIFQLIKLKYKKKLLNLYYKKAKKDEYVKLYKEIQEKYPKSLTFKHQVKKIILMLNIK